LKRLLLVCLLSCSGYATAQTPLCIHTNSDADGDGWGWEDGMSCQVAAQSVSTDNSNSSGNNADLCPDSDGDGWGWYNGASCRVTTTDTNNSNTEACIDFDGDGWGWANGQSCRVGGNATNDTPTAMQADESCVDYDGDGWGWANGQSCQVSDESTNNSAADIQVDNEVTDTGTAATVPSDQNDDNSITPVSPQPPVAAAVACDTVLSSGANIVNAVERNSGTICLRAGTYQVNERIDFKNNQTLRGMSAANPPVVSVAATRGLTTTQVQNVTLENLVVDGQSTGAQEFAILVGTGSRNIAIKDVVVQNTFGIGIGITGSDTVSITDTTVRNIGLHERLRQAVWVTTGSRSVAIDGLTVLGRADDVAGGDHAITCIDGVHGFTVRNSRSQYAGSGAIAINNCSQITVTNNVLISGREHGVDIVNGSTDALVQNNNIRDFDRSAMVFDDHSWDCAGCGSNPTRIRVIGNTMVNNNQVSLARCRGIAVDRNMVVNPADAQKGSSDWVEVTSDNTVDSDSALYCEHIH
jgi:hypothetical protein